MNADAIIKKLESLGTPENVAGMARFAIVTIKAFGVSAPNLRELAKDIKKQTKDRHELALELWKMARFFSWRNCIGASFYPNLPFDL